MLARSRLAWEAAGASRCHLQVAAYNTQASSSSQSGRKPPQVERAIRVKSQMKKQSTRQEPRIYGELYKEQQTAPRPFQYRQRPERLEERRKVGPKQPSQQLDFRQPRLIDLDNESERERGSIREVRYAIAKKLNELIKQGRQSPDASFQEGLQLFESVSGFTKREERIYNAMIRLAMRAGKRQWAIKVVSDMKKNGVAPSAMTYRGIFEGLSISKTSLSRDTALHQSVHDLFQELETTWRNTVLAGKSWKKSAEEEEGVENPAETSTARSYKASKREMEASLVKNPFAFDMSCVYYMVFLLSIKAYDRAADFLDSLEELALPRLASKGKATESTSKLAFLVSSRYLYELLQHSSPIPEYLLQTVPEAYKTVTNALIEDKDFFMDPLSSSSSALNGDLGTQRREVDRQIWLALSALLKCQIPEKGKMIEQTLQVIYDSERLATLPPITIERTLRVAMENVQGNPALAIRMFESALDYNDGVASRTDDKTFYLNQVPVNGKDVMDCWNRAFIIASLELKDLSKSIDLLQRAKMMQKGESSPSGSSRFTPSSSQRPIVFSTLMRLCMEKQEWNTAVQVWRFYFDNVDEPNQVQDSTSLQYLLYYFLKLASRLERGGKEKDDVIKYTRLALELLEKDFGLKNPALWERSEKILKEKGVTLRPAPEGQKEDLEVTLCVEYLEVIRATCRAALDTGEQGVDLADKDLVEKWKELRKKATQLLKLSDGTHFDDEEADWMRSGAKGKRQLALTDADMRELLD